MIGLAYLLAGGLLVVAGVIIGANLVTKGVAFPFPYSKPRIFTRNDDEDGR